MHNYQLLYLITAILVSASCICGSLPGKDAKAEDMFLSISALVCLMAAILRHVLGGDQ